MGFFDLTAVAGPVPGQALTFVSQLELWAALVGMLATSGIGILVASLRSRRSQRVAPPGDVPALRLVAPRVGAERA